MKIKVFNPYFEKEYIAKNCTLIRWKNFLENHEMGNETVFSFLDESTGDIVVINPDNLAAIEVSE